MRPIDVEELVQDPSRRSPLDFEALFESVRGDLWGYLVNTVHKPQDAEDLFQEVSLKAFHKLEGLRNPARFRSWIFAIAVNSVRGFFRRKPLVLLEEYQQIQESGPNPQSQLESRQALEQLRRELQNLTQQDRQILILDTMVGMPQQDIADHMGLNLNTVKTKIRRAKIKLARRMAEVSHA